METLEIKWDPKPIMKASGAVMASTQQIVDLAEALHAAQVGKGWYEEAEKASPKVQALHVGLKLGLIATEAHEAFDAARVELWRVDRSEKIGEQGFTKVEEELADLLIRVFDFTAWQGITARVWQAVAVKNEYNATRRPTRHGNKVY